MRNIGVATNITTEFWALRDGLILASQLGITQLLVELDAKLVDLVLSRKSSNNLFSSLLNDCRFLLNGSSKSELVMLLERPTTMRIHLL